MKTQVHLVFAGNCSEAFAFYEQTFGTKRTFGMTYAEAPAGMPVPADMAGKIMHTTMPLGNTDLLGCDAPADRRSPFGGFQVSVTLDDDAEVHRVYNALAEGGSVQMPLSPTFWSPLFGMCTDRFGVAWMVGRSSPTQL